MKTRLHKIAIRNFKAFREFKLDLEGRHLLVYGANGSGKSSLYWALHAFLQSARKSTPDVAKYFDPAGAEHLLNIHEQAATPPKAGEIALSFKGVDAPADPATTFKINLNDHETKDKPLIVKGDLASDFITYRFFFGFSNFRNSQNFNIWPLFEHEILPYCVATGGNVPLDAWRAIESGVANPDNLKGAKGKAAIDLFVARTATFAGMLPGIVDGISNQAQAFYDQHFSGGDPAPVALKLEVTSAPSYDRKTQVFSKPVIEFGIKVGVHPIQKAQTFLNEAKLTQLALSIRFAASLVNLHESDLKLLVLDDLLVSLDMSNRMKVVEILLSESFANYQKVVLTHDLGFFREFRRSIGASHTDWEFCNLEGQPSTTIVGRPEKSDIQKAEDFIRGHHLDEAALCLRKAVEDTAKRFIAHDEVVPTKDFVALADALRAARNKVLGGLQPQLYERVLRTTPANYHQYLLPTTDADIDGNGALSQPEKGILKTQRRRLRQLVAVEHVDHLKKIELIDKVLACTERVLNPAAHSGTPPLYEKELQDALDLVKKLVTTLQ